MQKRGLVILSIGVLLIAISFGMALTIFPESDPTFGSDLYLSNLYEDLFDTVTEQVTIYPDDSIVFTYDNSNVGVPLMWGVQIVNFQNGDSYDITILDPSGQILSKVSNNEYVLFDVFVIDSFGTYTFELENSGTREFSSIMMFVEDPENSDILNNPDSPLNTLILPLLISGTILIVGIVVTIVAIVIFIIDWKKERNVSRNY